MGLFVFQTSFPRLLCTHNTPGISQVCLRYFFRKAEEGGRRGFACLWAGEGERTKKSHFGSAAQLGGCMGACTHPGFLVLLLLIWLGAGACWGLAVERKQAVEMEKEKQAERVKQGELAACRVTADKQSKTTLMLIGICQANRSYFYRRLFAYILTKNPGPNLISLKCNEKYHFSTPLPPFLHVFSRHSCAEPCISKISWPLAGFKIVLFSAALSGCSLFL